MKSPKATAFRNLFHWLCPGAPPAQEAVDAAALAFHAPRSLSTDDGLMRAIADRQGEDFAATHLGIRAGLDVLGYLLETQETSKT